MGYLQPQAEALKSPPKAPKREAARPLLTIDEACDHLKIGRSSIYRLFNKLELPWVQVLSRRRVQLSDVEAYLAAHKVGGV